MTTPTLSPIAELRRAVCADPHDDTARLVLADALEEPGSSEQERQWAAMIRFHIALTTYGDGSDPAVARLIAGTNEPALLRDLTPWLRRGERCGSCGGRRVIRQAALRPFKFTIEPPSISPAASLFDTVEVDCPSCNGTGWLGSLAAKTGMEWLNDATFARGLVSRVELTAAQVQDAAFLARLFGEWPVTEAGLVGAVPYWNGAGYAWFRPGRERPSLLVPLSAEVPDVLIDMMSDKPGRRLVWKLTVEAANAALSAAVVSLGRAAAGLPQIGEG